MNEVVHKGKKMAMMYRTCAESYKEDTFDKKAQVANRVLSDFSAQMKKRGGGNYQPNSQAQLICTLIAYIHEKYEWNFSIDRDFKQEKGGGTCSSCKVVPNKKGQGRHRNCKFFYYFILFLINIILTLFFNYISFSSMQLVQIEKF